jgi:hypothetical protein
MSMFFTKYYYNDHRKEDEMGGVCTKHGMGKKSMLNLF